MEENFTVIPCGVLSDVKCSFCGFCFFYLEKCVRYICLACGGIIEICEKCLGKPICIEDCILQKSKWLYNKITRYKKEEGKKGKCVKEDTKESLRDVCARACICVCD